jgi:uncharacterized iron-regulated protein
MPPAALALVAILAHAAASQQPPPAVPAPTTQAAAPAYVPERVFDTRRNVFVDFEVMLAELSRTDAVFVGEQHDDSNTHRLELALLDGLRRRAVPVLLSLEMFERDVQESLDRYLGGAIDEQAFLKGARPWPRYATDYRDLVELARTQRWTVLAANVPRRLAATVAKGGREAIEALPPADRALAAADLQCPHDAYFEKFKAAVPGHGAGTPGKTDKPGTAPDPAKAAQAERDAAATLERYYLSQCLKDETMAESIVQALGRRGPAAGTLVHVNGAFHSDFGLGTAERVRRRMPAARSLVVSMVPVPDIDTVAPSGEDLRRADFLVYTVK